MTHDRTAAIATPLHVHNYGSVLQAYATVEVLRGIGIESRIVDYIRPDLVDPVAWAVQGSRFVRGPITSFLYRPRVAGFLSARAAVFEKFIRSELPLTRRYTSIEQLQQDPPSAQIYVTGSDQAWNTSYNIGGTEPYLLSYAPEGASRISLATSFGKSSLSENDRRLFSRHLPTYTWISVRERSAKEELKNIGIDSEVMPDPTLMMGPAEWRDFGDGSGPSRPYALVYCLNRRGGFSREAATILRSLRIPPVVVRTGPLPRVFASQRELLASPRGLVSLFAGAKHVITDSFHGLAFCLNLGIPVSVIMPPRYTTRLENLLTRTDAQALMAGHPNFALAESPELVSAAQEHLSAHRDRAISRLREIVHALPEMMTDR